MPMHRDHAVHAPSGMLVPPVPPARRRHVAALAVALGAVVAGGAAHAAQSCPQLPPGAGVRRSSLTPLVVRPLQTVIEPVPATDGLVHLAYAAQATNMHQGRAEILSIVPVDPLDKFRPTGRNRVLDTDGAPITGKVRLFAPPLPDPLDEPPQQDFSRMPGGSSGITFFDVTYQNAADVPRLIAHRITVRLANVDDTVTELTDPVPVDCRPPVVLSPPLTGHRWWDANGCCEVIAPHRGATLPINGEHQAPRAVRDRLGAADRPGYVLHRSGEGAVVLAVLRRTHFRLGPRQDRRAGRHRARAGARPAGGRHRRQRRGQPRHPGHRRRAFRAVRAPAQGQHPRRPARGRHPRQGSADRRGGQHRQQHRAAPALPGDGPALDARRGRAAVRVRPPARRGSRARRPCCRGRGRYEAGRPVRTDTAGAGGRADRMPAEGQIFAFRGP